MRAVAERVKCAQVEVDRRVVARIELGLLVYLGVDRDDGPDDLAYLVDKITHLRIFPDDAKRLNRDVRQVCGEVLVVSAFSVQADARKGRRPSFDQAAPPDLARRLYQELCRQLSTTGIPVQHGSFGDDMIVHAVNDGPICLLLDSRRAF